MSPTSTQNIQTPSPLFNPTMTPQTAYIRRTRPSHVQTNLPSNSQHQQQQPTIPASAISASSVASSSQQGSPIMSPEAAIMTTNSSVQASPEHRGRGLVDDQFPTGSFQLPEPVISRKTSDNSLGQTLVGSPSAMSEAVSKSGNLMRRLSNKTKAWKNRRRTSSAAPNSRDGSVGPGILRRRSDSNTTAPPDFAAYSDSDDEFVDEIEDLRSLIGGLDGAPRESSSNSTTASVAGSTSPSNTTAGPVIPFQLLKGTWIRKVSKKNWKKRFILVLEPDAAKISWDKNRPHKCLYIDDIKEIRTGSDIRQYRIDYGVPETEESRWFSIMYSVPDKSKTKMMHLVADDASTFYNWVTTLEAISKHRQDLMASLMAFNDRAIRDYWLNEMTKQGGEKLHSLDDGDIDFEGVQRVCRNLHIHASPSQLRAKFHAADVTNTGRLNFFEFQTFVGYMKRRDDIRQIYHRIAAKPETGLTIREFLDFLRDVQGENVDADLPAWEALYTKFARKFKSRDADAAQTDGPKMGDAAFAAFLTSTYNLPVHKEPKEYTLDRPLNEYFVSSSHNTYLMGRQVAGLSSVEGYISALARGCRCVEVDCWDGPDGQPTVNHGRTLTTSISFQETMTTINKYAFVKTKYPLWISLEVHCNPQQQAEMARIIKETFGARLVTEPLDSSDRLPSPEQLKERVLIKVKRPQPAPEPKPAETTGRRRGNSLTSPYPKPVQLDNSTIPPQSLPQSPILSPSHSSRRLVSKSRVNTITEGEVQDALSSSTSDNDSAGERVPPRRSSNKTVKVLGDLGVYCAGVKFGGFDAADAKAYNHIFSFMESSFMRNSKSKEERRAIERHNMRYLMRVYPDRTRITSNNFNPVTYWRKGVQMAALNWQTFDLGMQLNQAMYESGTDRSGYVLKPSELREIKVMPQEWSGFRERQEVTFTIDVISAQQLMRPNGMPNNKTVDPYVEVEVFHSSDKREKRDVDPTEAPSTDSPLKFRTRVIPENGFNPIFDGKFTFKVTTKFPELIFIRWSVKLSHNGESYNDRPPVATHTAKLNGLKRGYRTLPLFDHNGEQYLFSTLFCRVNIDSVQTVLIKHNDESETISTAKPRGVGRVFNTFGTRSNNISPKSSMDKSGYEG
ncbi:phosphatidylinositol-specific phospholipase C [Colletotrichum eremochloae]|nr:phosphatidylinositol-specific phospholipase C [Colletotrichum eremochloae]